MAPKEDEFREKVLIDIAVIKEQIIALRAENQHVARLEDRMNSLEEFKTKIKTGFLMIWAVIVSAFSGFIYYFKH